MYSSTVVGFVFAMDGPPDLSYLRMPVFCARRASVLFYWLPGVCVRRGAAACKGHARAGSQRAGQDHAALPGFRCIIPVHFRDVEDCRSASAGYPAGTTLALAARTCVSSPTAPRAAGLC